ncbi:flagellar hook-basal body complex protein [Xanthomonas campestris pv. phormiicola]|nr:flagellar hook-basal body complex protein [Xanthomonas campestris pv. phormiicola]UYC17843.1 flagellar hook-basal body complex protein [Xanthomonas campestris pv. phormiicola]
MSFNIALSGLNAVSSALTQISNNIANSATYGFKSGSASFASSYADGKGAGTYVNSVSQTIDQKGNIVPTGRGLDAAVDGRGFFVVADSDGSVMYTRTGQFSVDANGFLVDASGRHLRGYSATSNGALGDLSVPSGGMLAKASASLSYAGTMSADWSAPATATFDMADPTSYNAVQVTSVYDSLGREHTLSQYFVRGNGNQVDVHYATDGTLNAATGSLQFDTSGQLTVPAAPVSVALGTPTGAAPMVLAINYTGTVFAGGKFSTTTNAADGNAPGSLTNVTLDGDGSIQLGYSNGQKVSAGQLALASFPAEEALSAVDGNAWQPNAATGAAVYGVAGSGLLGALKTQSLESSNVNMANELVNLMSTQQNYQANSKVLSSENEMIKTLMQAI